MNDDLFWKGRKVLVILPFWSATFINKNFGKLISRLRRKGARVHVYCTPSSGDGLFQRTFPDVVLHNTRISRNATGPINLVLLFFRFFRVLVRVKPDCVLWTYAGDRENLLLWGASRLSQLPYVIKSDSVVPGPASNLRQKIRQELFIKLPASRATLILAETPEVLRRIQQAHPNTNVYYFPNGVPISEFQEYEKKFKNEKSPLYSPYMLFTGRIMHLKGVDLLIEAFLRVAHKIPEWHLVIVGDVWEKEFAEYLQIKVRDNGLAERVHFYGFHTGEALARWYYFAEFYLLPSRHEGLANRLTEAMYFGLPVVAFDVGQTKALVTSETGILVEPENVEQFSKGMLELAQNASLRRALGRTATKKIKTDHDDDLLFNNLFNMCEKVFSNLL